MKRVELLGAARVRALLDEHEVVPSKSLGQNFVIDPNTIRKTLAVADLPGDARALEVGPGAGSLTLGLAAAARTVVAIERDERLVRLLHEVLAGVENVELVHADVLSVDLGSLGATDLVANLPYNIAASVVLDVLQRAPSIKTLTVMTQREVGERLAAPPGSKVYGATSVLTAFFAEAKVAAAVSRNAFWPVPNVDSVIIRIDRRTGSLPADAQTFSHVVKAAFGQRRKTLRNTLSALVGSAEAAEKLLASSGIDPSLRPESLNVDAFAELARRLPLPTDAGAGEAARLQD